MEKKKSSNAVASQGRGKQKSQRPSACRVGPQWLLFSMRRPTTRKHPEGSSHPGSIMFGIVILGETCFKRNGLVPEKKVVVSQAELAGHGAI